MFYDPVMDHPVDGILQPAIEPTCCDGIKMRGNVGGFNQPAQRERGVASVLQRAIYPQGRYDATVGMQNGTFVQRPLNDRATVGFAIVIERQQPLDQRLDDGRKPLVDREAQRDIGSACPPGGQAIDGVAD